LCNVHIPPVFMHFGMLKQVKPHFVNRNLTSCLTLIETKMCIAGFTGTKYYGPTPLRGP